MLVVVPMKLRFFLPCVLCVLTVSVVLNGCDRSAVPSVADTASAQASLLAQQRREIEGARQRLDLIPPPSKARYLSVKTLTQWENPYLTVQGGMVTLHVVTADANPSQLGLGGSLRPMGARRQDLNVRIAELPAALNAVPPSSWPYGRVVAVEEAHEIPVAARPEVRRNMETVLKTLGDLGVVVYEGSF